LVQSFRDSSDSDAKSSLPALHLHCSWTAEKEGILKTGIREMKDFRHGEKQQWLQQMEPVLGTLNDGVAIIDDSEQILFVNTIFEEMAGIVRGEIIGHDARKLNIGAEDFDRVRSFRDKVLEKGRGQPLAA